MITMGPIGSRDGASKPAWRSVVVPRLAVVLVVLAGLPGIAACRPKLSPGRFGDGKTLAEFQVMTPPPGDCASATTAAAIVNWLVQESTQFEFVPPARLLPQGACQTVSTYAFGPASLAGSATETPSELIEVRFQTFGAADPIPTRYFWTDWFLWQNGPYRARRADERNQTREVELGDRLRRFDFKYATAVCRYNDCEIYLVRNDVLVVVDIASHTQDTYVSGDWNDAIVDLVAEIDNALNAVK